MDFDTGTGIFLFSGSDQRKIENIDCVSGLVSSGQYVLFCRTIQTIANSLKNCGAHSNEKTLVKLIDEYNYSKYTQGWV